MENNSSKTEKASYDNLRCLFLVISVPFILGILPGKYSPV